MDEYPLNPQSVRVSSSLKRFKSQSSWIVCTHLNCQLPQSTVKDTKLSWLPQNDKLLWWNPFCRFFFTSDPAEPWVKALRLRLSLFLSPQLRVVSPTEAVLYAEDAVLGNEARPVVRNGIIFSPDKNFIYFMTERKVSLSLELYVCARFISHTMVEAKRISWSQ